jgi:hypothetical protein
LRAASGSQRAPRPLRYAGIARRPWSAAPHWLPQPSRVVMMLGKVPSASRRNHPRVIGWSEAPLTSTDLPSSTSYRKARVSARSCVQALIGMRVSLTCVDRRTSPTEPDAWSIPANRRMNWRQPVHRLAEVEQRTNDAREISRVRSPRRL